MSVKLIIVDEVKIKLVGLPLDARKRLVAKFKFENPSAKFQPAVKLGRWDGAVTLFGLGGDGFLGHLERIMEVLESMNIDIGEIEDKRQSVVLDFQPVTESYWSDMGKTWPVGHERAGTPIMLRDYQVDAVNKYLENTQGIQSLPTGSGKTLITATLAHKCESIGRSIIIVPNKSLVEQTEEDFINCGLDVGVYYGGRKDLYKTHTICTWQSLNILNKKSKDNEQELLTLAEFLDNVNTVIIDEVHCATSSVLRNLLTQNICNAPVRWGLTGTIPKEPCDYEVLYSCIGPLIGGLTAYSLQEAGVLANCHVTIKQLIDVKAFKSYPDEVKYLVTNPERMTYIASLIAEIATTGNTLVLVNRIDSGKFLIDAIEDSVFISGNVKTKDRKSEYDEVKTATNKVIIATYGVAAVGINIPRIFNLVLLEPGKSFVRVIQSIGRGIRKADDKDYVDIWDITSSCKYSKRHLTQRKALYKEAQYPSTIEKIDWSK
jgi:superfamily II DNA or RNA helicase